jgi:ABC-type dipeptide/oligopeptide/nickel transport system permease subunit
MLDAAPWLAIFPTLALFAAVVAVQPKIEDSQ